jgi:hypothetical protein
MGGTYDPETGRIVWEAHVPIEEQHAHYAAHPPSCLGALEGTAIDLSGHPFDGHGEPVNTIFAVRCPCGSRLFTALGHFDEDGDYPLPPVILECAGCRVEHVVFDASRHGFDGVVGNLANSEPEGQLDELCAADVGGPPCEIILRFEFPSDVLGDPEWSGREPELFSWITIVGRNPSDGRLATLFELECA